MNSIMICDITYLPLSFHPWVLIRSMYKILKIVILYYYVNILVQDESKEQEK